MPAPNLIFLFTFTASWEEVTAIHPCSHAGRITPVSSSCSLGTLGTESTPHWANESQTGQPLAFSFAPPTSSSPQQTLVPITYGRTVCVSSRSSECEIPPKHSSTAWQWGSPQNVPSEDAGAPQGWADAALPKSKGLGGSGVFFIADSIRTGRKTIFPSFCIMVII